MSAAAMRGQHGRKSLRDGRDRPPAVPSGLGSFRNFLHGLNTSPQLARSRKPAESRLWAEGPPYKNQRLFSPVSDIPKAGWGPESGAWVRFVFFATG